MKDEDPRRNELGRVAQAMANWPVGFRQREQSLRRVCTASASRSSSRNVTKMPDDRGKGRTPDKLHMPVTMSPFQLAGVTKNTGQVVALRAYFARRGRDTHPRIPVT